MSMEINNTELSDNVSQSENNDVSDNRIFDDSKIAKLNGIRTRDSILTPISSKRTKTFVIS